jgi:hypothetical protein
MTSTTAGSSTQLVVSFTGNTIGQNPFTYTGNSDAAAPIECLCVVSNSAFSIGPSTSYTNGNCTRYIMSGFPAFLTVRINANAGQNLLCYFPGFRTPNGWSSNGGDWMYVNFYADRQNHFKTHALPNQFRSIHQTTGVGIGFNYNGASTLNVNYNSTHWETYGKVNQNKYYQLRVIGGWVTNPVLYVSSYNPKFQQSICNSGGFIDCRAYNSFVGRRYFLVAQVNGATNTMNLTANFDFPQSEDMAGSFYGVFMGWTTSHGWNHYTHTFGDPLDSGYLSPATPSLSFGAAIYSNTVQYSKSLMTVAINLNGYRLYSNQRTQGAFFGSFISLTLNSFSTLYGCGAVLFNTPSPVWSNNALYCIIHSNSEIRVYSNADWSLNNHLYITFYTDNVPQSTAYSVRLFDKYYSGSDYGLPVHSTGTFNAITYSGSTLPPTSVIWRRPTYR